MGRCGSRLWWLCRISIGLAGGSIADAAARGLAMAYARIASRRTLELDRHLAVRR
jgi:hypothetical protein